MRPALPWKDNAVDLCLTFGRPAGAWTGLYDLACAAVQTLRTWFSAKPEGAMERESSRTALNRRAEEILDSCGNSILRYAYSYLHNISDAEEILQDTLVQFLKTAPAFETRQHEKAWLLRVAGNLSKNRLAYNAVRRTDELNEELTAENREDLSFVWDAVRQLPENYRAAIHLFYYEGYSTRQIAGLLQKKEATVRSDLRRGREKLKAVLREVYDFDETVS